jgi:hypothetical protein
MALHVRTTLGDALWRSEAGLPLLLARAGGGTPRYSQPSPVRREVMSATHRMLRRSGRNCRSTRSVAGVIPGISDRRLPALAGPDARDTGRLHQPRDPLAADPDVVFHP